MIIDSSVVMAILLREPDAEHFERIIEATFEQRIPRRISAASILGCEIVSRRRLGDPGSTKLDNLLTLLRAQVAPFDADQLRWARFAAITYGRGQHAARLNFGDCFSYALAKSTGEPLLYKGGDFAHTDIATA
jgi:ribonuclease VapC